jgi:hypothetical protein
MKKVSAFLVAMGLFLSNCSLADATKESVNAKVTFMPENNLHEQDSLMSNNMTQQMFDKIIDQIEAYYKPIVAKFGGKLVVERKWSDNTVNAYAQQIGSTWKVTMFGGLARRDEMTPDGFAMVVCHELGHHLAGFPNSGWASYEGQSDYFALQACASNLWAGEFQINDEAVADVDSTAKALCDKYYSNDPSLCYRKMNASYSLANLLAALGGDTISFDTPDKTIVKKTASEHPAAQCRLDTYVAGTLCEKKWGDTVMPANEKESAKYLCTSALNQKEYSIKARPRCWFKPTL